MILAQISNAQRVYMVQLLTLALDLFTPPARKALDDLIWQVMNGYQDRDGILFELTSRQRSRVMPLIYSRMNTIGARLNGWLDPEYAALEALAYHLMVGCAE